MNKKLIQNSSTSSIKLSFGIGIKIVDMHASGICFELQVPKKFRLLWIHWNKLHIEKELFQFLKDKIDMQKQHSTTYASQRIFALTPDGFWYNDRQKSTHLISFENPLTEKDLIMIREILH